MYVVERGLRVWPAPNVEIKQCQKRFRDTHLIRTPCTGAPEDHFLYYICSEKQKLRRIFYSLRKAKNFYKTIPFIFNFRNISNKFPKIFLSLIFCISVLRVSLFSVRKGNLKFSDSKMQLRGESEKFTLS